MIGSFPIPAPLRASPILRALSNREFAFYTAGNSSATIGLWIQRLAIGWLAWRLTGSSVWLGAIAFAQFFPTVVLGPLFGVVVDRIDRRRGMIGTQLLTMVHAILLWAVTASGAMTIELLTVLAAVQGLIAAAVQPLRLAIVPSLVDRADMGAAIALTSVVFNVARFVGPALAGVIIATWGIASAFAAYAAMMAPAVLAFALIHPRGASTPARPTVGFAGQLAAGVRYARDRPRIGRLLVIIALLSLASRGALEFLPAFADTIFERGVAGLAAFTSAMGLGSALAGLWVAMRKRDSALLRVTVASAVLTPIAIGLFAIVPSFAVAVGLIGLAGALSAAAAISSQTLIQLGAEDHMRGRVMSLWSSLQLGGPAVGALLLGLVIAAFGLRDTVIAASALAALGLAWFGWRLVVSERA